LAHFRHQKRLRYVPSQELPCHHARSFFSVLLAALLASPASFAFNSPLSDEAIREAYFLGQRHDGSSHVLDKYSSTPGALHPFDHISHAFAKLVYYSDAFVGNYSAHKPPLVTAPSETVEIHVEILLPDSYGPIIRSAPTGPQAYQLGPRFWKDFQVEVLKGMRSARRPISPANDVLCSALRWYCNLIGATLHLEFGQPPLTPIPHHPCHPARRPRSLGRLST